MKRNDKIILSLTAALITLTILIVWEDFGIDCENVRSNTLRLHILANSDSYLDQRLKLKVRDAVLKEFGNIFSSCTDLAKAENTVEVLKDDIKKCARKALLEEGCCENVKISLTNMYFDSRCYENGITMPAGRYDALRIEIGEGKGQNWWCVMYPPLCLPVYSERSEQNAVRMIESLNSAPCLKAKFAIIELGEIIKEQLRNR